MAKKNLKESVLRYEIQINLDNVLDILWKLKFVNTSEVWFESLACDWLDNNPSEKDINKVLKELGY